MNRLIAKFFVLFVELLHVLAFLVLLVFIYVAVTNEEILESASPVPGMNIFIMLALAVVGYIFIMGMLSLLIENYKNLERIASRPQE